MFFLTSEMMMAMTDFINSYETNQPVDPMCKVYINNNGSIDVVYTTAKTDKEAKNNISKRYPNARIIKIVRIQ